MSIEAIVTNGQVGHRGWIAFGLISGSLALRFAPLMFGTMALYAAVVLYQNQFRLYGLLIGAYGAICTIVGVLPGVVLLSPF